MIFFYRIILWRPFCYNVFSIFLFPHTEKTKRHRFCILLAIHRSVFYLALVLWTWKVQTIRFRIDIRCNVIELSFVWFCLPCILWFSITSTLKFLFYMLFLYRIFWKLWQNVWKWSSWSRRFMRIQGGRGHGSDCCVISWLFQLSVRQFSVFKMASSQAISIFKQR